MFENDSDLEGKLVEKLNTGQAHLTINKIK